MLQNEQNGLKSCKIKTKSGKDQNRQKKIKVTTRPKWQKRAKNFQF